MVLQISGNAESASPRFRAKSARPLSNVKAGSGNETSEVLIQIASYLGPYTRAVRASYQGGIRGVAVKAGLWTLDWTMDWTLDWTVDWILDRILDRNLDQALDS